MCSVPLTTWVSSIGAEHVLQAVIELGAGRDPLGQQLVLLDLEERQRALRAVVLVRDFVREAAVVLTGFPHLELHADAAERARSTTTTVAMLRADADQCLRITHS